MKCKTVIVTGASSGIGLAVTQKLLEGGFKVYGVGRNFEKEKITESCEKEGQFVPIVFDMQKTGAFYEKMKLLSKKEQIGGLINNAGTAYYGPHETLSPAKIHEMITINLEVPMVLCQLFMRNLKQNSGHIINISSVTAKQPSPHGCAYGATKAGLSGFSSSLFEEVRKYGVKVTAVHPEMTKTNLYRHADFCEGEDEDTYLEPGQIADSIMYILSAPETMTVTDVTMLPQRRQIRRKK